MQRLDERGAAGHTAPARKNERGEAELGGLGQRGLAELAKGDWQKAEHLQRKLNLFPLVDTCWIFVEKPVQFVPGA